ncbi:MAG: hypothetical protein IKP10_07745 [Clostridia bacterium]|nr:hypothetical protein [Clostridia bacterium]
MDNELNTVEAALRTLRLPLMLRETDVHAMVAEALARTGLPTEHEKKLGPRCRIDFLCGSVGVEVKRGPQQKGRVLEQLRRYAAGGDVKALVLVTERNLDLPPAVGGVPLRTVCLSRLWGIAL